MRNRTIAATATLLALLMAVAIAWTEYDRYTEAIDVAERDTRNAAGLAAAHASQVFADVRSSLRGVQGIRRDVVEGRIDDAETIRQLLDSVRGASSVIQSVGWTDEAGRQIGRSTSLALPTPAEPFEMGEREHFRYFRDNPDAVRRDELHISKPIRTRIGNLWRIIASVPLVDAQGRFAGTAGAAIDPFYFTSVYRNIDLGPSRVATLYLLDGTILSRSPDTPAWIGNGEALPFADRLTTAPAGTYRTGGPFDEGARIVSYRAVPGLPLAVTFSLSYADALAPFYRSLRVTLGAALLAALTLAGSIWLAVQWVRDRRRSRQALEDSEQRYRALAELSPVGVFRTDAAGLCTYANDRWCGYAGLAPPEALGRHWTDALHPEDRARVAAEWTESAAERAVFSSEFRFLSPTGRATWLFGQALPALDAAGAVAGHIATVTDITERKRHENALRDSEDRFRALVNTTDGVVWEADARTFDFTFVSDKAERLLGYPGQEWLGAGFWAAHVHPDDRDDVVARRAAAAASLEPQDFEYRFLAGDGRIVWVHELSAVALEDGRPRWLRGIMVDITKYKQAEEALRRSQKMEAIGLLTGGIAHDFNNLLNVILSHAELLGDAAEDPDVKRSAAAMIKSVERGAELTRKLLTFSRTQPQESKRVSVNAFIQNMKGLIARSLTPAIRVKTVMADDAWPVDIDPGDLEDAILNLAINARDAMPGGGSLLIETANKVLDERYAERNPGSSAGEFLMISVSDTGAGMSPEVAEKAFEPFFTTKPAGRGTGLGLSMVYGFVQRSGGHAKIYSELGRGTSVHLYLPRARAVGQRAPEAEAVVEAVPRGHETILVVDDEPSLIEAAVVLLGGLGYRTLAAEGPGQALALLRGPEGTDVDLLFSDVIMPGGMDGYQLAIEALHLRPDLKVLLTSGFTRQREEFLNGDVKVAQKLTRTLLGKPYNLAELAGAVRRALDE